MAIKEFFEKVSTSGDVAATAVGYAVGFAVDVFLFPGGVPPGTVAGVSAVGALGLKKAADAVFSRTENDKAQGTRPPDLERKANALLEFLGRMADQPNIENPQRELFKNLRRSLKQQIELWQGGILEEDEFKEQLSEIRLSCIENTSTLKDTDTRDRLLPQ